MELQVLLAQRGMLQPLAQLDLQAQPVQQVLGLQVQRGLLVLMV